LSSTRPQLARKLRATFSSIQNQYHDTLEMKPNKSTSGWMPWAGTMLLLLPVAAVALLVAESLLIWTASPSSHGLGFLTAAAGTTGYLQPGSRRASPLQQQQQQQRQQQRLAAGTEWDNHIIFDGGAGQLDKCAPDHSWPQDTWVKSDQSGMYGIQGMLPHTARVQQAIWEHQHPSDCSKAKFLLYRHPALGEGSNGIGSVLHLTTTALQLAMRTVL
jgi:hypothetical protein